MNTRLRSAVEFVVDVAKIVLISLALIIPVRYFIVQPFFVRGASMVPTYHQGDYLLVDEISYRFGNPKRGDVIIFRFPGNPSQFYIKRIIGLPGETVRISDGAMTIVNSEHPNGFVLKEGYLDETIMTSGNLETPLRNKEYFVLGDNRDESHDSRRWGVLGEHFIIGRVFLRAWPFNQFGLISTPSYSY